MIVKKLSENDKRFEIKKKKRLHIINTIPTALINIDWVLRHATSVKISIRYIIILYYYKLREYFKFKVF